MERMNQNQPEKGRKDVGDAGPEKDVRAEGPDNYVRVGCPEKDVRAGGPDNYVRVGCPEKDVRAGGPDNYVRVGCPLKDVRAGEGVKGRTDLVAEGLHRLTGDSPMDISDDVNDIITNILGKNSGLAAIVNSCHSDARTCFVRNGSQSADEARVTRTEAPATNSVGAGGAGVQPEWQRPGPTPGLGANPQGQMGVGEGRPSMPPTAPLVTTLASGKGPHQQQVNGFLGGLTESCKAQKAAWLSMERYYTNLKKSIP
ncbi:hypothetical protein GWK47_028676 [Chionoecetes opilio]|uniref:Uncharacterized protein n=1 Tax=Chionoecetes opilio TaxID=41210 RepID=A0A8J4YNU5_CHIOP|nr:hypothetical protein GWK47_028676 [Chionoecetes opilio]